MQSLKQKFQNYKSNKKLQSLWKEYKKVSHLQNNPDKMKKFEMFIDSCQHYLNEMVNAGQNNQIEQIFGQCSDILDSLFKFLNDYGSTSKNSLFKTNEKMNDLVEKVLEIAEYILKDPKYRKGIENSPTIIGDFINLMEKVENKESSICIMKIIILISENMESKLEFGRNEGFKKLLQLLSKKDENISRMIFKALLHFLNLKDLKPRSKVNDSLNEVDTETQRKIEEITTIRQKVARIVGELRKLILGEIERVFKDAPTQQNRIRTMSFNASENKATDEILMIETIPTYDALFNYDFSYVHKELKLLPYCGDEISDTVLNNSSKEEVVKELLVDQGALSALCGTIARFHDDFQLVSLETLSQLLANNPKNQEEFAKIKGYKCLKEMFSVPRAYEDEYTRNFLKTAFDYMVPIIIDNEEHQVIKNYDAFLLLLELMAESNIPEVTIESLQKINEILKKTWRNSVIGLRMKIINYLSHLLIRLVKAKAMKPDGFLISSLSIFNKLKEDFNLEKNPMIKHQMLKLIMDNFKIMSLVLGTFNLDTEIILSEIVMGHLIQGDQLTGFFFDNLIDMLEGKMTYLCARIIILDYNHEFLFRNLKEIIGFLLTKYFEDKKTIYSEYLFQLIKYGQNLLKCDHHHDDLLKAGTNNSFADLLLKKDAKTLNDKLNKPKVVKGKNEDEFIISKFLCKNVCEELQKFIISSIKEEIMNQSADFMPLFYSLIEYENLNIKSMKNNTMIIDIMKSILNDDEDLINHFLQIEGHLSLGALIYQLYIKHNEDSVFLNNTAPILFELCVGKNNIDNIMKSITKANPEIIPLFDMKRIKFLQVLLNLLTKINLINDNYIIFDCLYNFLHKTDNMKIFLSKDINGISYIFDIMLGLNTNSNNLYDQLISLFEICIIEFKQDEIELYFETFFNNDIIKKVEKSEHQSLIIDSLSLLFIHFSLNTNPMLIERFYKEELYLHLLGMLDSNNLNVIEMILKAFNVIFALNTNFKKGLNKQKYCMVIMEQIKMIKPSDSICRTLYELCFATIEKVNYLYPPNSSTVSTIINRSNIADQIIKLSKNNTTNTNNNTTATNNNNNSNNTSDVKKEQPFTNIEFFEILLSILKKSTNDQIKFEIFRDLESALDKTNLEKLIDSPFITWICNYLKDIEFNHESPPKYISQILTIMNKIFLHTLDQPKQIKIVDLMKKILEPESLSILFLNSLIEKICENPLFKKETAHIIKNLYPLLSNVEEIVGINPKVMVYMMYCINLLASKNSGEIRSVMKSAGYFELRDNLLIQILKFDLSQSNIYGLLKDFSFEAIANQSKFRESQTIAILMKIFLTSKSHPNLQQVILKILKYDIAINEENQKYVAKLIENPNIISYLYPNLSKNKLSSVSKCFKKEDNNNDDDQIDSNTSYEPILNKEAPLEEFVEYFNSAEMENERKQILLRISKILIDVENEKNKNELKIATKQAQKKNEKLNVLQSEKLQFKTFICDTQLKIGNKLSRTRIRNSQAMDLQIQRGDILLKKMFMNEGHPENEITNK